MSAELASVAAHVLSGTLAALPFCGMQQLPEVVMEIRTTSFNFPRMRGNGPRVSEQSVVFPRGVDLAVAAMTGYSAGFRGGDHHLGRLTVQIDTQVTANVVVVRTTYGLRDWSGDWDDDYAGTIDVCVLAELVDASLPPPRGDLQVTGIETNQATQSFRSGQHLDSDHVLPDNAIPLIGGKTTGVRVYVDYDASSGLPPIGMLSGVLTVSIGANTLDLVPLANIVPRRDHEISRGEVTHTLNFAIPGDWCHGAIDARLRVFDATDASQSSGQVLRTLRFVEVNPMRVFGVGIHYTGQGLNLAAPSIGDTLNTFDAARRIFPLPEVLLSGFMEMDFGTDLNTSDTTGCGDGFEDLQGDLHDLQGDTDDLVYGLLPGGITYGNFIGCGGDGAGSGEVFNMTTAAHEAGHAYGRKHVPCDDVMRCGNPDNTDEDYPHYALFHSDSIGEFGYDPEANAVFNPADSHDIMSYSGNRWISPYTYAALMSRGDPVAGGNGGRPAIRSQDVEVRKHPIPLMQLDFDIDRDGNVTHGTGFTFPARLRLRSPPSATYRIEARDGDGKTLHCVVPHRCCYQCGDDCWPREVKAEIPMVPATRKIVLLEGEETLATFDVPDPPKLALEAIDYKKDGTAIVRWKVRDDTGEEVLSLVHWQDERGAWRGIAPRNGKCEIVVPKALRLSRRTLPLRILASNGLATGTLALELDPLKGRRDPDKDPPSHVHVAVIDKTHVRATLIDELGRTVPEADIRWFGANGQELMRGASLHARDLPGGKQLVRAVAVAAGAGRAEREVEMAGSGRLAPPSHGGKPPRQLPVDIDKVSTVRFPKPEEPIQ